MSKLIEQVRRESSVEKKRGIGDIPYTIRNGMKMTQSQLRFSLTIVTVVILALVLGMMLADNKAANTLAVNEEAAVLQDAIAAERIEVVGGKTIRLSDQYAANRKDGSRTILTEKISTSKNYWLTVASRSEVDAWEEKLGADRFIELEAIGEKGLWITMATDAEIDQCRKILESAEFVSLNQMDGKLVLTKGSAEENARAAEIYSQLQLIQFEKLGANSIRLRRGSDTQISKAESRKSNLRLYRLIVILLLIVVAGGLAYTLKSGKVLKLEAGKQRLYRLLILAAAALLLVAMVWLTAQMNAESDRLTRIGPMIMKVDGQAAEELEDSEILVVETEKDAPKFSFTDSKGNEKTVSMPKTIPGFDVHRILFYVVLTLLVVLAFALLYLFRYERDLGFPIFNTILLIILMFITLYPVLNTVATSFNDGTDALRGGIGILPRKFSMKSYDNILSQQSIFDAAWVSASKTVIITLLNLFWTGMLAYTLSRREYVLRKFITTVMVLTMYVNAGLIPNYLLISRTLNLAHSYWVYIIPTMFSCFNMIVIRTYIAGLPDALVESAKIDGAGDFRVYWQIIFPLCMPVLATVALFVAVGSWNSWFDTRLYCANQKDPQTLQYLLQMKILTAGQDSNAAKQTADALKTVSKTQPITIRAAITVVSTVPILVVYPMLQKYFVTGMALGAVKG